LIAPETLIEDRPTRFGSYAPQNFGKDFNGTVTIREALARSLNIPAVKVLERVGPGHLIGRMTGAGIATELPRGLAPNLAIALGGIGMDLHALVRLYAGIARNGDPTGLCVTACTSRAKSSHGRNTAARLLSKSASVSIRRILLTAPPPPNARGGRIAFKTGTSYGHRDAWAVGFDGRHVIGVWVGRPDATATPDLLGRTAAAPVLFDAFKRVAPRRAPFIDAGGSPGTVATSDLPAPLKRFETARWQSLRATYADPPVAIVFPPDRSVVELTRTRQAFDPVMFKAEGGVLPLTWLADGKPISQPTATHRHVFQPNGDGFVTLTVIDARGRAARSTVRLKTSE
ncbi:MAG: penicillin-binding protein 1C, partial [Pseudomonadota bacterium]